MATLLEKNTQRLLAARRNPQLPYENRTPYWPQGGMNALNSIYESYLPQVNGGMLPNANVTDTRTTPKNFWDNTGLNPDAYPRVSKGTINRNGFYSTPDRPLLYQDPNPTTTANDSRLGGFTPVQEGGSTNVVNTPGTTTSGSRPFMNPSILKSMGPQPIYSMDADTQYGNYDLGLGDYNPGPLGKGLLGSMNPPAQKGFNINSLGIGASGPTQTASQAAAGIGGVVAKGASMATGLGMAAQLAPVVFNMIKGLQKPERTRPNYNPYESSARSLMANRRFNVDPMLNSNRNAQAVANRNIRNTAGSRGEMMANFGAAQNYRMAGDASAWSQKNNMDNEYMGQQAQMDAQLGQQRAQMDWNVQNANAQNKAAQQQFLGQGFSDLGQFGQVQQQMSNQKERDKQLLGLYPDMFGVYNFMNGIKDIENSFKTGKQNGK